MKALITSIVFILTSSVSQACYINNELRDLIFKYEKEPKNVEVTFTDSMSDWSKEMGAYVTFEGEEARYIGFAKFNQVYCTNTFADIRKVTNP